MDQKKIDELLVLLADALDVVENGGDGTPYVLQIKLWLLANAPSYLKK